jgi:Na+/H+ antiporter NhaC
MSHMSHSVTVDLDRPRTVIVYLLYCFVCLGLSVAIPYFGLSALSHWG